MIDLLLGIGIIKSFNAEDTIFYDGDNIDKVYFVVAGNVSVVVSSSGYKTINAFAIDKGSFITVSDGFSLVAGVDSEVIIMDSFKFNDLLFDNRLIFDTFMENQKEFKKNLFNFLNFNGWGATEKVCFFIDKDIKFFNKNKKKDIAAKCGIEPETLSRVFKKLVLAGVIAICNSDIIVKDEEKLKSLFLV